MKKRKLLLYALLIGMIVYFLPFFAGHYTEIKYNEFISHLSEFEGTQLTPISYERHWRHSDVKTRVTISKSGIIRFLEKWQQEGEAVKRLPDLTFIVKHKIHHGPLVHLEDGWKLARAAASSHLYLSEESKKAIEAEIGTSDLIHFNSLMDIFEGQITVLLDGIAFRTSDQEKNEPDAWGGVKGKWRVNSHFDKLEGELIIPGFYLDIYNAHFGAKDLEFKTRKNRSESGVWHGQDRLRAAAVIIDDPEDGLTLNASGVMLSSQMKYENDLIGSSGVFRAEQIDRNEDKFGPVNIDLYMNNIPTDIYFLLKELIRSSEKVGDVPQSIVSSRTMAANLPRLLNYRPEFVLQRVYIRSPEGDLKGQAGIAIGGKGIGDSLDREQIRQSIVAEASLDIPKQMFRRVLKSQMVHELGREGLTPQNSEMQAEKLYQDKITSWIGGGYLIDKGDAYEFRLSFLEGVLMINGVVTDF